MRTIKFRGKRLDNGLWVDGDLVTSLTPKGSMSKCPAIHTTYGTIGTFFVKSETVGQFTGLHDRNGKEIYEGDILRGIYGTINDYPIAFTLQIKWNDARCGFYTPNGGYFDSTHYCEVIGNIHDNPELLEDCKW